MKLKLNKRKNVIDIPRNNITFLKSSFLFKTKNINRIKIFKGYLLFKETQDCYILINMFA